MRSQRRTFNTSVFNAQTVCVVAATRPSVKWLPFYQHPSARPFTTTVPAGLRVGHWTHRLRAAKISAAVAIPPSAVRQRFRLDQNHFVCGAMYIQANVISVLNIFDEEGVWRNGGCHGDERKQKQTRPCKLRHSDTDLLEEVSFLMKYFRFTSWTCPITYLPENTTTINTVHAVTEDIFIRTVRHGAVWTAFNCAE